MFFPCWLGQIKIKKKTCLHAELCACWICCSLGDRQGCQIGSDKLLYCCFKCILSWPKLLNVPNEAALSFTEGEVVRCHEVLWLANMCTEKKTPMVIIVYVTKMMPAFNETCHAKFSLEHENGYIQKGEYANKFRTEAEVTVNLLTPNDQLRVHTWFHTSVEGFKNLYCESWIQNLWFQS